MWKSPNATSRSALDGTVFRAPILIKGIEPYVKTWEKPITLARHAYGDLYRATEMKIDGPGKCELVFTAEDGTERRELIHNFTSPGVAQGIHNLDNSIRSFARCCMSYALDVKQDLIFSAKDTISKVYDRNFREIFKQVFMEEYMEQFRHAGLKYEYCLIDDAVSRVIKNSGGYVWACQNYDGDVMSDLVAAASGSLPMMTSVLVSPDGCFEYEAAHGTVTDHFYRWRKGEKVSTNPLATMFAWAGALRKRGELDGNADLVHFSGCLEQAGLDIFEAGHFTEDLTMLCAPSEYTDKPDNDTLLGLIRARLEALLTE